MEKNKYNKQLGQIIYGVALLSLDKYIKNLGYQLTSF